MLGAQSGSAALKHSPSPADNLLDKSQTLVGDGMTEQGNTSGSGLVVFPLPAMNPTGHGSRAFESKRTVVFPENAWRMQ